MTKKIRIFSYAAILISMGAICVTTVLLCYPYTNRSVKSLENASATENKTDYKTIPITNDPMNPYVTTYDGPVYISRNIAYGTSTEASSYKSKIVSLDWNGQVRWIFDTEKLKNTPQTLFNNRNNLNKREKDGIMSLCYDVASNKIFILTKVWSWDKPVLAKQFVIELDANTGGVNFDGYWDFNAPANNWREIPLTMGWYSAQHGGLLERISITGSTVTEFTYDYGFNPTDTQQTYSYPIDDLVFGEEHNYQLTKDYMGLMQTPDLRPGGAVDARPVFVTNIAPNKKILFVVQFRTRRLYFNILDDKFHNVYNGKSTFTRIYSPPSGIFPAYYNCINPAIIKLSDGSTLIATIKGIYIFWVDDNYDTSQNEAYNASHIRAKLFTIEGLNGVQSIQKGIGDDIYFNNFDSAKIFHWTYNKETKDFNESLYIDIGQSTHPAIHGSGIFKNGYLIYPIRQSEGKLLLINRNLSNKLNLEVGIKPNPNNSEKGYIAGTINYWVKDGNFNTIPEALLAPSLFVSLNPAEIQESSITISEDGRFLSIKKINEDDVLGSVDLEVGVGYKPWFCDSWEDMRKVTYKISLTDLPTLEEKSFWSDVLPFNLNKTLPSIIKQSDLQNLDLFHFNLEVPTQKIEYTILNRNDATGELTIEAEVLYRGYNSKINKTYKTNKIYQLGKSADVNLDLLGESEIINDINDFNQLDFLSEGKYLASSINIYNRFLIEKFINLNSVGYPLNDIDFTIYSTDDIAGTIDINLSYQPPIGSGLKSLDITKSYGGFNKISDYEFGINGIKNNNTYDISNLSSLNGSKFAKVGASHISELDIYSSLLNLSGYDLGSFETIINGTTNHNQELNVSFNLDNSFKSSQLWNKDIFTNGKADIVFTGFNSETTVDKSITFIDGENPLVTALRKLRPSQIQEYQVEDLFEVGSYFKQLEIANSRVIYLYPNDENGTLEIEIKYVDTFNNIQLAFTHTYSGFISPKVNLDYHLALNPDQVFVDNFNNRFFASITSEEFFNIMVNKRTLVGYDLNAANAKEYISLRANDQTRELYVLIDFTNSKMIPELTYPMPAKIFHYYFNLDDLVQPQLPKAQFKGLN